MVEVVAEGSGEAALGRIGGKSTGKLNPAQKEKLALLEEMSGQPRERIMSEALKLYEEAMERPDIAKAARKYQVAADALDHMEGGTVEGVRSDPMADLMAEMKQIMGMKMLRQMMKEMDGPAGEGDNLKVMRAEMMMREAANRDNMNQLMQTMLMTKMFGGSGGEKDDKMVEMLKSQLEQQRLMQEENQRQFRDYMAERERNEEKRLEAQERKEEREAWEQRLMDAQAQVEGFREESLRDRDQTLAQNAAQVAELKRVVEASYNDMSQRVKAQVDSIKASGEQTAAVQAIRQMMEQMQLMDEMVMKRGKSLGLSEAATTNMLDAAKAAMPKSWPEAVKEAAKEFAPVLKEINRSIELFYEGAGKGGAAVPPPPPPPPRRAPAPAAPGAAVPPPPTPAPAQEPPQPERIDLSTLSEEERAAFISRLPLETQQALQVAREARERGEDMTVPICKDHYLPLLGGVVAIDGGPGCRQCAHEAAEAADRKARLTEGWRGLAATPTASSQLTQSTLPHMTQRTAAPEVLGGVGPVGVAKGAAAPVMPPTVLGGSDLKPRAPVKVETAPEEPVTPEELEAEAEPSPGGAVVEVKDEEAADAFENVLRTMASTRNDFIEAKQLGLDMDTLEGARYIAGAKEALKQGRYPLAQELANLAQQTIKRAVEQGRKIEENMPEPPAPEPEPGPEPTEPEPPAPEPTPEPIRAIKPAKTPKAIPRPKPTKRIPKREAKRAR